MTLGFPIRDNRAFTLIELVVVISLITIMLMVAIPRLEPGLFSNGGDETARWIIANVNDLKARSVMDQRPWFLYVSIDARQMWVSPDNPDASLHAPPQTPYLLPDGVSVDQVDFSRTDVVSTGTIAIAFYPKGYSDKAVIRIRNHERDRMAFFIEPFLSRVRMVRNADG